MRPTWAKLGQLSANLGPTWGQLGALEAKSDCIFTVFFKVCVKIEFSLPRAAQEAPRDAQEAPRAGHERPKKHQDGPKSRQERPKSIPRAAQLRLPGGLGGSMGPKSLPKGSRKKFWTPPRGAFPPPGSDFAHFCPHREAFSKLSFGQSLCKHTASVAQRVLCNFYMWISTATDSR